MIDFIVVDSPILPPHRCIVCTNARGKMIDTHFTHDLSDQRIYICRRCVKRGAQLFGLAPGEKMELLENADAELDVAKGEIEVRNERIEKLTAGRASDQQRIQALETLLEAERNKQKTLAHVLQVAKDNLAEANSVLV